MLRAALGEAGADARGLWLDDRQQGWNLRLGNVQGEMIRDAAERGDRRGINDLWRSGPIWGLHFSRKF